MNLLLNNFRFTKWVYPLPNIKILDSTKLKSFADDNIIVASVFFDREENILDKEKMLVTSILPFSHNVFRRLLQDCKNQGYFGKMLESKSLLPNNSLFKIESPCRWQL